MFDPGQLVLIPDRFNPNPAPLRHPIGSVRLFLLLDRAQLPERPTPGQPGFVPILWGADRNRDRDWKHALESTSRRCRRHTRRSTHDWRYDAIGAAKPDFILTTPATKGAEILLTGDNFGCGSSREHAPWALLQFGFRAVISTSFADIFQQNSLKNSFLPVVVPKDVHAELFALVAADPSAKVQVDLAAQKLTLPGGRQIEFSVDVFSKQCLLEGVDELGYILAQQTAIAAYESTRPGSLNTLA